MKYLSRQYKQQLTEWPQLQNRIHMSKRSFLQVLLRDRRDWRGSQAPIIGTMLTGDSHRGSQTLPHEALLTIVTNHLCLDLQVSSHMKERPIGPFVSSAPTRPPLPLSSAEVDVAESLYRSPVFPGSHSSFFLFCMDSHHTFEWSTLMQLETPLKEARPRDPTSRQSMRRQVWTLTR